MRFQNLPVGGFAASVITVTNYLSRRMLNPSMEATPSRAAVLLPLALSMRVAEPIACGLP
jgi:hypothetical protein